MVGTCTCVYMIHITHTHARPPPPAVEAVQADTTHHSHRTGGCWLHLCTQRPMPLAPSFHTVILPLSRSSVSQAARLFLGESRRVTVHSDKPKKKLTNLRRGASGCTPENSRCSRGPNLKGKLTLPCSMPLLVQTKRWRVRLDLACVI